MNDPLEYFIQRTNIVVSLLESQERRASLCALLNSQNHRLALSAEDLLQAACEAAHSKDIRTIEYSR